MSREYLFRGKRVDNGEWVYGYYMKQDNKHIIVDTTKGSLGFGVQVYEETVGQYVGFEDKNGKKIFEDDVFAYRYKNLKGKEITRFYVITYDNELGYWSPFGNSDYGFYAKDVEIVGNIHDNKELLGE